mgnify:CR=1 FL=1
MTGKTREFPPSCPNEKPEHSPLTYNRYLKVSDLKKLQVCLSDPPHHDEPLFIVIHQTYELWFKLIIHELDEAVRLMKEDKVRRSTFYLRRVGAIMKLLVQQIHILETMTPRDFLGFRENLTPASGFQSSQFRELEFIGGLKSSASLEHFKEDTEAFIALEARFNAPSLGELFYDLLARRGFSMPVAVDASDEEAHRVKEERIQQLIKIYEDEDTYGDLLDLAEALLDFDEQIFLWRFNHVTVVERIIGFKRGTGGSEGVSYLRSTLDKRCFPELWQLRTYFRLPGSSEPATASSYGGAETAPAATGEQGCPFGHS